MSGNSIKILAAVIGALGLIAAAVVALFNPNGPVVINNNIAGSNSTSSAQIKEVTRVVEVTREIEKTVVVTLPLQKETVMVTSLPKTESTLQGKQVVPTASPGILVIQSRFDGTGFDGWKINTGSFTNPGSGGGCGADNGCLIFADSNDNTSWWIAPAKFYGDWRVYSKLQLDLWSSGGKIYTDDFGDIYIVSGNAIAQRRLSGRPPSQWQTYGIPLIQDGEWELNGAQSLDDVLANVTGFQIRAEFGNGSDDKSGLDNVALVP